MSSRHYLVFLALTALFLPMNDVLAAKRRATAPSPPPFNVQYTEGGYADQNSVEQGGSVALRIATAVSPFTLRIVNLAQPGVAVHTINGLQSSSQNCSGRFLQGCDWSVTTTLTVPMSWPSGYYAALFPTSFGERAIPFVVRENAPGSTSRIAVLASTHTWQVYNDFGGRSTYPSDDPRRAHELTYNRPYAAENGLGRYGAFERPFVDWMTTQNRLFEVITDSDLEDPSILPNYALLVIPGQSQYWTASARAHVEQFSAAGGHLAVLNASTMWWQIRLSDDGRTIVTYKGDRYDPAANSPLQTTNFFASPVNNPENRLLGASFRNGGYANRLDPTSNDMKPVEERSPWTVTDAGHWILQGTSLRTGDTFGRETTGLELDGVVFNCNAAGAVIGAEGSDEAPRHYEILAVVPGSEGWGTMGLLVHPSGGAVFNAATNAWNWGLQSNPIISRITTNVLDRLSLGTKLPYQPVVSTFYAQDLFNCPQPIPATGWESKSLMTRPQVTASCAYEGPGGLELSGEGERAIARAIAPRGGASRQEVFVRFAIKTDELQQRTVFPLTILGLEDRNGENAVRAATVEIDASNGKRIRIARRPPAGGFAASDWVTLADGWHVVQMGWRSPGTLTLTVDGGSAVTLENPDADQRVNRVVLSYPTNELTSAGRVCIDAFAAASVPPPAVSAN